MAEQTKNDLKIPFAKAETTRGTTSDLARITAKRLTDHGC